MEKNYGLFIVAIVGMVAILTLTMISINARSMQTNSILTQSSTDDLSGQVLNACAPTSEGTLECGSGGGGSSSGGTGGITPISKLISQTLVLQPSNGIDTWIEAEGYNNAPSNGGILITGRGNNASAYTPKRSLIKFDFTLPSHAVVESAKLELYHYNDACDGMVAQPTTLNANRILLSWDEDKVTSKYRKSTSLSWNTRYLGTVPNSGLSVLNPKDVDPTVRASTVVIPNTVGWVSLDIAPSVIDAWRKSNNGLLLWNTGDNASCALFFWGSESATTNKPKLTIKYKA